MKANYNKKDLEFYLPDYIANKISETDLIGIMENEIRTNPEFEKQFNEIKSAMNFLGSAELEPPHENYFTNLPVKINERILSKEKTQNIWEKLSLKWKLIIHALVVIVISVLLLNFWTKDSPEIKISENDIKKITPAEDNTKDVTSEKSKEENLVKEDKETELKPDHKSFVKPDKQSGTNYLSREKSTAQYETESSVTLPSDVSEITDVEDESPSNLLTDDSDISQFILPDSEDEIFFPGETEDQVNIEEESQEFTPEELKKILEKINKSQI